MSNAPNPTTLEQLLTEEEAAKVLGIAPGTLMVWRSTGRYALPYVKVGRCVRYKAADLAAFVESRRFEHTSRRAEPNNG